MDELRDRMAELDRRRNDYNVRVLGKTTAELEAEHEAWREKNTRQMLADRDVESWAEFVDLPFDEQDRRHEEADRRVKARLEKWMEEKCPGVLAALARHKAPQVSVVQRKPSPLVAPNLIQHAPRPKQVSSHVSLSKRFEVLKRDFYRCRICGRGASPELELEIDHKVPVAKGGSGHIDNLWTLCFDCNRGKQDKPLEPQAPTGAATPAPRDHHDNA